jgi:ABC-type uncharacterized transport system substrate-binding protein
MSKIFISVALSAMLFAPGVSTEAQQPAKIPRIGLLYASAVEHTARIAAFRSGLRDLGYVEKKNIGVEYRYAEAKAGRFRALAGELVRLKVKVIVTGGPTATRAAKEATSTIPIVMARDSYPVVNGFVASLARPGGNITGLSSFDSETSGKRLELLKAVVPRTTRVAVLGFSANPGNSRSLKDTQLAGTALGVELQYLDARGPKDIETAFRTASQERIDALLMLNFPPVFKRTLIPDLAAKSRIPTIYTVREYVEAGGLMSYGASITDLDRRAATYVDKILKGATPADLPVERPTKLKLVTNLTTAKALGLKIPPQLLMEADRVME